MFSDLIFCCCHLLFEECSGILLSTHGVHSGTRCVANSRIVCNLIPIQPTDETPGGCIRAATTFVELQQREQQLCTAVMSYAVFW